MNDKVINIKLTEKEMSGLINGFYGRKHCDEVLMLEDWFYLGPAYYIAVAASMSTIHSGYDYNIFIPISNIMAEGKTGDIIINVTTDDPDGPSVSSKYVFNEGCLEGYYDNIKDHDGQVLPFKKVVKTAINYRYMAATLSLWIYIIAASRALSTGIYDAWIKAGFEGVPQLSFAGKSIVINGIPEVTCEILIHGCRWPDDFDYRIKVSADIGVKTNPTAESHSIKQRTEDSLTKLPLFLGALDECVNKALDHTYIKYKPNK